MALISRLGVAFLGGLVAALVLVIYLSRSVTRPLQALSRAADQVAAGRYDAKLPRSRSDDEIGHLTDRFREMTDRLAESQRRERTFLMVVSHELRTPVTAIRGHIEALQEGLAEDAEARDASLEVIRTESDRLARLVGDVLDLARLDARRFTLEQDEVEMQRLVEQAYQAFSEARRRGIEYERPSGPSRSSRRTETAFSRSCRTCSGTHSRGRRTAARWSSRSPRAAAPSPSPWPTRGRASRARSAIASSVPSTRDGSGTASASRSRGALPGRSAVSSVSSRRLGADRGSSLGCRLGSDNPFA